MSKVNNMDSVRGAALERIEKSERNYKMAFFAAAVVEAAFIAAFLLLADFSNRVHLLLLISTVAVYSILALGMFALGSHVSRSSLRVLKAVELLGSQMTEVRR
jgi:hypothetical protein